MFIFTQSPHHVCELFCLLNVMLKYCIVCCTELHNIVLLIIFQKILQLAFVVVVILMVVVCIACCYYVLNILQIHYQFIFFHLLVYFLVEIYN